MAGITGLEMISRWHHNDLLKRKTKNTLKSHHAGYRSKNSIVNQLVLYHILCPVVLWSITQVCQNFKNTNFHSFGMATAV